MYNYDVAHSRPSIKGLLPFVAQLAPNWHEIGMMLLEEKYEICLSLIKAEHGSDKQRCLAMLQYWMETHSEATWHDLVTALKLPGIVELTAVASAIERNFTGKILLYTYVYITFLFLSSYHSFLCELQLKYVDNKLG